MIMKKTYLRPEIESVNVVTDSIVATSPGAGGDVTDNEEGRPGGRPGIGAKEQQGDWDNIWN